MKTSFRRQIVLILCVMSVSLLIIGIAFRALLVRSVLEEEETALYETADSVCVLVDAYSTSSYFSTWDFRTNLSVAAAASGSDVLILTPDGQVMLCANDRESCEHLGKSLPRSTVNRIFRGSTSVHSAASTLYGDSRVAVAVPVTVNEVRFCIVLVSVESADASALTSKAIKIFIATALVVLLVILMATPYLAHRETRPIHNMAIAARHIAHGDLSVRVETGHRNEEIEELALAFNNMAISLQHAETVRQEFVANVSHELKTPMTTIAGYLDGMTDGTIPKDEHPYYMDLVSTEVRRLSRLVRSMLDVSRLRDQGIPADKMSDFDICEAAGQALLSFEQRINRKDLNVEIDMPDLGLTVHAASDLVTQVLYNLFDNAVKFIDDGGTLSIRIFRQGPRAVITVGNTGPTIAPSELPLLFDRFHKTDKSRSTDRDGVGLGLYIVKTIVMAHGEDIYVTSRDGKTEFTFTLKVK